ncbi:MAG: twin-arginine translocase TatA/TatE family subunit [Coriobacteriia bacterium]|nr:twin-arginine translocase TatA/TatE family subunit [Coriobacteriia bacterium]
MFGLSFTEIVVLLLVGLVVIGPRQLPSMLRTAGQWITKLRRMSKAMQDREYPTAWVDASGLMTEDMDPYQFANDGESEDQGDGDLEVEPGAATGGVDAVDAVDGADAVDGVDEADHDRAKA